jgi:hypothetical protein
VIIGFNTDVRHRGRVFHAQTEDKGLENPLIETLVYTKGQIHEAHHTRYDDVIAAGYDEKRVIQLMEDQHRRVIALIKSGHYLTEEEKAQVEKERAEKERAIGAMTQDERFLDEIVRDWINNEMEQEEVELIMSTGSEIMAGHPVQLRLKATKSISRGMIAGAKIVIRLISTTTEPRMLFEGETDRMGECIAGFALPQADGAHMAIIVRADSTFGSAELRQLVTK